MGLGRLNTRKILVFGIFWVRRMYCRSKWLKNVFRLVFDDFVHLFHTFARLCCILAIQNHFFPMEKKYNHVSNLCF